MIDKLRRLKERASRMFAEGKLQEALGLYLCIVEEDPRELGCRVKVGDIYSRLNQPEEARNHYEEVARIYAEDGFLLKAIAVCKLILLIDPEHTSTLAMLADLYARKKGGHPQVPALPIVKSRVSEAESPEDSPVSDEEIGNASTPSDERIVLDAWPASQPVQIRTFENGQLVPIIDEAPPSSTARLSLDIDIADVDEDAEVVELFQIIAIEDSMDIDYEELDYEDFEPEVEELSSPPLIPLFSELPKKAFVEMLVRMPLLKLRRGQEVIREGASDDAFYVIATGLVSVSRRGQGNKPMRLAHLGEGAFFGEMALLQDGVRTATVTVEEDAQIFEVSRELIEDVIAQYPTVATAVRNFYRQRLLATAMATHPLFMNFPPEERRELMDQFKSRSFASGETILEEGKKGSGLYLLLHGKVEVTKSVGEERMTLAELQAGDLFGEISLITNMPVTATITAMEEVFVLRLSKRRFDELILGHEASLEMVGRLRDSREAETQMLVARQLDAHGAVMI